MGQQPSASLRVHINPNERCVISFKPRACCGTSPGFEDEHRKIPTMLHNAGITQETWNKWINDYEESVAPQSNLCAWFWCLFVAWMFLFPGIAMLCCYNHGLKSPFQRAARAWLERVNTELGSDRLCKFQTMIEQYDRVRVETTTLSFALTHAESQQLASEPVLVFDPCCDCWGNCLCEMQKDRIV